MAHTGIRVLKTDWLSASGFLAHGLKGVSLRQVSGIGPQGFRRTPKIPLGLTAFSCSQDRARNVQGKSPIFSQRLSHAGPMLPLSLASVQASCFASVPVGAYSRRRYPVKTIPSHTTYACFHCRPLLSRLPRELEQPEYGVLGGNVDESGGQRHLFAIHPFSPIGPLTLTVRGAQADEIRQ